MVRDFLGCRRTHVRALARRSARSLAAHALPRASLFFACAKKSNQKKHTPGGVPFASRRVRNRSGNFRKGHPAPAENGARPVRRPAGLTRPACHALTGAREAKAGATTTAVAFKHSPAFACAPAFAPGAPSAAVATVGKPEGRRARRAAFWAGTGMCLPKIPAGDTDPDGVAVGARRPGCAFFGYFLCTSKESDAPRRARHDESSVAILRGSARSPSACA